MGRSPPCASGYDLLQDTALLQADIKVGGAGWAEQDGQGRGWGMGGTAGSHQPHFEVQVVAGSFSHTLS